MNRVIIYDYEVFRYDTLLGCIILEGNTEKVFQSWEAKDIENFYKDNINALWIGHNNVGYDDYITESITKHENPYIVSQKIIPKNKGSFAGDNATLPKCKLKIYSMDLMRLIDNFTYSLKLTELLCGKNIHVSEIDFNLPRPLTEEEKALVNAYNLDDLKQTLYNFKKMSDLIKLRLDMISNFKLDVASNLNVSGATLAAKILKAKYKPSLEYAKQKPVMYDCLKIKNQEVLNYYLNEEYRTDKELKIKLCDTELMVSGNGGIHGAVTKTFEEKLLYIDVSGYYNLIAILFDLLPRTLSEEAKKQYVDMYYEQLELKKTNPAKREQYKVILLAVIGSMDRKESPFYDPENYLLLTTLGRLFIIDLLEKLDGLVRLIQANTDGIMVVPKEWKNEAKIKAIIEEWVARTKFNIKLETLYRLWQRDVNCYCCADEKGELIIRGEALKNYDISDKAYGSMKFFKCKEPPIIAQGIVNYLMYGIEPEEFVNKSRKNLKLFQYACSPKGANYLTYDVANLATMEHYAEKMQGMDRAFAYKSRDCLGVVYKHWDSYGKHKSQKYPNLPDNVFIYNYALEDATEDVYDKIDYQYYIDRIYKKIRDFIE